MLKKSKLLLLPVCLFASSMAASAEDGTITFTGTISSATCIVSGGTDEGLTPSGTFTVNLKPVSTTALDVAGKKAGDTPFYISLSGADCPNGKFANVSWERAASTKIDSATGNLMNSTASGSATKVQVVLSDENKQAIDLRVPVTDPTTGKAIANNAARFDYWAQYIATGGATGAGTVNTDIVYSIIYN
ncbi:fimbrial protein [Rahnella perminowiae]|uniref:Type 1 fimbrial protein n=2 Tax=Rahnella perminowiae TaxID=2816244 RepID=A0ABS6L0D8_9GAMM|nr:fimbrial protein [Rahnella perminowiae]MBU9826037.1 type 1 fimbrial protein [Rahnella perminowiae]MBU9835173.1 type 1 fimbrial protein [Rahnella perminowiae]MCR8998803.1 type 1 fimbrial protein [Rahnella perminowiae]